MTSLDRNDRTVRMCHWVLTSARKRAAEQWGEDIPQVDTMDTAIKMAARTIRDNWAERCAAMTLGDISTFGDHMTAADWVKSVKGGFFIDYDGSGQLATKTQKSSVAINPSDITTFGLDIPKWATHVIWSNK